MILTTTIDINYLDHLIVLINSIKINSPNTPIHCRLININDDSVVDNLNSLYRNIIIEREFVTLSTKRTNRRGLGEFIHGRSILECIQLPLLKNSGRFLCSDQQCYTSNTRFRNFLYLFERGESDVVYLDADSIVRKDLSNLSGRLLQCDIACKITGCYRYPNDRCWECSFLYGKNNSVVKKFFNEVRCLAESDMKNWDSDQIALETVYSKNYKDMLTLNENLEYIEDISGLHGESYSEDSLIWSGSGLAKYNSVQFLTEQAKYR